jgi:dual specificity protein phosphatase-like protein
MPTSRTPKRAAPKSRTHSPSEVAPGIFVGGWKDAEGFTGAKVCVLDERPEELAELGGATHVPIYDGSKDAPILANLDRVADLMHAAHQEGRPVLVFCGHGVRRGSLGGAWYLHRYERMSLDAAFDRIESVRPQIERPKEWMNGWKALGESSATNATGRGRRDAQGR